VAEGRDAPELSSLGTLLQPLLDFHPTTGSYSGKVGGGSPNDETPLDRTHAPTGHTTVNSTTPQPFPDCGEQDPSVCDQDSVPGSQQETTDHPDASLRSRNARWRTRASAPNLSVEQLTR
jgi:hypothetical protein